MLDYKVIVPVSGGKDSQACLRLALQHYPRKQVLGMFCDTKFEHPQTYRHVEWLAETYRVRIHTISSSSVPALVLKYGRFPGHGSRFCTDELKIIPSRWFYENLAKKQGHGFEVWLGMRTGESRERRRRFHDTMNSELYAPHELMGRKYPQRLAKLGVMFRLPVVDWTAEEVFEFIQAKHNPLYDMGFERVGCFPCLAAGDKQKKKCFTHDVFGQQQYEQVVQLSTRIQKSIWSSKQGEKSGCSFCEI